jgi:hypothetical protein
MPAFCFQSYLQASFDVRHHRRMSETNPVIPSMQDSILQASTALRFLGPGMTAAEPLSEMTVIAARSIIYVIIVFQVNL